MQGWRSLAEVARELGVTDRTLQRRLCEAGIRPARPGRSAMLSDADVTKLMEESRKRSKSSEPLPEPRSPDKRTSRIQLLTEIGHLKRMLDDEVC